MATCSSYILIIRVIESALKILTENQRETRLSAGKSVAIKFIYVWAQFGYWVTQESNNNQSAYAVCNFKGVFMFLKKNIVQLMAPRWI